MKELVNYIVGELVENKDGFSVELVEGGADNGNDLINVYVCKEDIGRVIGKEGRIAKAIRTIVHACGTRVDKKFAVEIIEK